VPKVDSPFKPRETSIGLKERLLRQIVCQRLLATRQPAQESAQRRLVLADEFAEGMPVVVGQYASDKFCNATIHSRTLEHGSAGKRCRKGRSARDQAWLAVLLAALERPIDEDAPPPTPE